MIILDTNVLVNILRNTSRGQQWVKYLKNKSVGMTVISAFELFLGAEISKKN